MADQVLNLFREHLWQISACPNHFRLRAHFVERLLHTLVSLGRVDGIGKLNRSENKIACLYMSGLDHALADQISGLWKILTNKG